MGMTFCCKTWSLHVARWKEGSPMKAHRCWSFCADKFAEIVSVDLMHQFRYDCGWQHPKELIAHHGPYVRPVRDTLGRRLWVADKINQWVEDSTTTEIRNGVEVHCIVRKPKDNGLWYGWRFEWADPAGEMLEEMFIASKGRKKWHQ